MLRSILEAAPLAVGRRGGHEIDDHRKREVVAEFFDMTSVRRNDRIRPSTSHSETDRMSAERTPAHITDDSQNSWTVALGAHVVDPRTARSSPHAESDRPRSSTSTARPRSFDESGTRTSALSAPSSASSNGLTRASARLGPAADGEIVVY